MGRGSNTRGMSLLGVSIELKVVAFQLSAKSLQRIWFTFSNCALDLGLW